MESKKRGRVKLANPKDVVLRVRVDQRMDEALRAEAERRGVPVAKVVREALGAILPSD